MSAPDIPGLTDLEEVGRGGFGVVYRAQQELPLRRLVAVKVLSTRATSDTAARRFASESQAMASLSTHPNIVTVHDAGVSATGEPFLIMEYAPGGSYASLLPLTWRDAVDVAIKVCGALETAHRAEIIHRDIKPENILVSAYGEPKLTDFGIAKVKANSHTTTGGVTASLLHAAPEVLSGSRPAVAADVYSMASTLFAMIAGSAPFESADDEDTLAPLLTRICTAAPPDLRVHGVPESVCSAITGGLAKESQDRPATALDFANSLIAAQVTEGVAPTACVIEVPTPAARESRSGPTSSRMGETTDPLRESTKALHEDSTTRLPDDDPRRRRGLVPWLTGVVALAVVAGVILLVVNPFSSNGSPGRTASSPPASSPVADDTPAVTHRATARIVTARASHLAISANVRSAASQCRKGSAVLQQHAAAGWRDVAGTHAHVAASGRAVLDAPRSGRYRVNVVKRSFTGGACAAAHSAPVSAIAPTVSPTTGAQTGGGSSSGSGSGSGSGPNPIPSDTNIGN